MLKLVFSFGNSKIPNFYGVVKNLPLFCLDESLYGRPYSGYLFSINTYRDLEDSDSTPTTAIMVRIRSLIFYNCYSDGEDKIVTHDLNNKLV